MPIPQKDYIIPILVVLNDTSEWKTEKLAQEVYKVFTFGKDDLEDMGYGHSRRYKNLNWAKTWLAERYFIKKIRHGYWQITEKGTDYLKNHNRFDKID